MPTPSPSAALLALVLSTSAFTAAHAQIPIFLEFQVNTYTSESQALGSAAAGAGGGFVVVWESNQDGENSGVFAQRFSTSGFKSGLEFRVNTYTTGQQVNPSVAMASDGRFVVVWNSTVQDGSESGIFGKRFDAAGNAVSTEFQVNAYTTNSQGLPQVAIDWFGGAFVVSWQDESRDGLSYGVFARRFNSAGAALGGDFQVNTYTTGSQNRPVAVVLRADGAFVIAWNSLNQDDFYSGVFARRFDSSGGPQAVEFQVNQFTPYSQSEPAIAALGGGFVVAWQSTSQDGNADGLFGRRFDSSGAVLGAEFQINAYTTNNQRAPAIAVADDHASFVVSWEDFRGTPDSSVFARGFTGSGLPFSNRDFQVNALTGIFQSDPVIAGLSNTNFVVAWTAGDELDGSNNGVFARRYRVGVYDVDCDGVVRPLTDGLIVLRSQFGISGPALVAGALGANCTRCEADGIEQFIGTFSDYDLDGNGVRDAKTDGILLVRYLFGFRGAALIEDDAIGDDCSNCDAPAVEAHVAARL